MGEEGPESLNRLAVTMKDNSSVLSGYRILFRTMKVKLPSFNFLTENIIWENYKENKNHPSRIHECPTLPSGMPCAEHLLPGTSSPSKPLTGLWERDAIEAQAREPEVWWICSAHRCPLPMRVYQAEGHSGRGRIGRVGSRGRTEP